MNDKSTPSRVAKAFARIIDFPWLALLSLLVLTALACGGYVRPSWPRELAKMLHPNQQEAAPDEPPAERFLPSSRVCRDRLGQAAAFLVVDSEQIFTREGAAALRHIVRALEDLETVERVKWLEQAPPLNIFGLPEPVLPHGQASPQRFALARAKAVQHPLIRGIYLSGDARTLLLGIDFNWVFVDDDADCTTEIVRVAQQVLEQHPGVKMQFSVTGDVPLRLALLELHASNELTFRLIGYAICLLMAVILFRGVVAVVVVAAAPAIGVFWSSGFLHYFGWEHNPFSQVVLPVLLSLVGFADGVHMIVFIRQCLRQGQSSVEACRQALQTVGVACGVTTITTAMGMGSLAFSQNSIVREFAYSCVLGSTTILVAVLLVIPLVCRSRWGGLLAKGADRGVIDQSLNHVGRPVMWVVRYARWVAYGAVALLVGLASITLCLRPDDRQTNALPSGSEAQKTLAHLDNVMGGLEVAQVRIDWKPPNATPHQIAVVIDAVDQLIDQEPLLAHPLSLCRVLAALPGDATPVEKMPLAELLPPPLKLALYDPDQGRAIVTFRVKDLGTAKYEAVFERLEAGLKQLQNNHVGFDFTMVGDPIGRWKDLYRIVSDLALSLGTASFEILIVMALAFRSLRLGLIAIVPNMIPLAASGTFMVLLGWPLDIVSVCSFTICLGIAVDDTIHFLSRYREEMTHQSDHRLAIEQAFQGVGTGMIMTTIVLISGFCSVLVSNTRDHRVFGVLGIITLMSALLCDLFLLPSLLAHFDGRLLQRKQR